MDGDADQLEREVADSKAELAAEMARLRGRAREARQTATRRSMVGALAAVGSAAVVKARRRRR